ncbi:MAG TPA: L,D-transpeptidase family protein [Sphingomicrobium sp.]|nr:L,D-transpeptidase family protein [Sphingomicrobium sp.]
MKTGILLAAGAALLLPSGIAQAATASTAAPSISALPYQSANLPTAPQVQSFYATWQYAPIWFRSGSVSPAASDLVSVLQRSSLDGLNGGPEIASVVQQAVQRASTGDPAAVAYAEHTLSEALVLYAQTMKQPVPGMTYGYGFLMPRPVQPAEVLLGASVAPSLQAYVQQLANPNTIYTSIRDAAWRQMQASGTTVPDPRVVANLDRARGMPAKGRFVMVNTATQMLYMYQDGVPVGSMKVVVGDNGQFLKDRPDTRTPLITSMMYYVIHNPYWNSSDTLTRLNIAPRYAAEGDKYFKARGFKVMSDWSADAKVIPTSQVDWKGVRAGKVSIRIRQDPGPDNFMGQLKFPFANPQDIYLHDTDPGDRDLFALSQRTRSNGCIRLENAPLLAHWLIGHDPLKTDQPEYAEQLAQPVPIFVTYLTAQPQDGQLTFVKDVYGMDPTASTTKVASGK